MNKQKSLRDSLADALKYDKNTGHFFWIKKPKFISKQGFAGCKRQDGYVYIKYNRIGYLAHRLAWFFFYGDWPKQHIDHINGIKHDNRICNLRDVSNRQNQSNRKTHRNKHLCGTAFHNATKKWMARIRINEKQVYLGVFKTQLEAHSVYEKARQAMEDAGSVK